MRSPPSMLRQINSIPIPVSLRLLLNLLLRPHHHRRRGITQLQRQQRLLFAAIAVIRAHNALYQLMPHHVLVLKVAEADAFHPVEHLQRLQQSRLLRIGQIDLRQIARNDGALTVAKPGHKHLHLLAGRVLRLIHDD